MSEETLNKKCLICKRLYGHQDEIPEGRISHGVCPDQACQEEYAKLYGPAAMTAPRVNPPYSDEDYDLAREIIDAEMGSFQADPRGYVRSAGWDPAKVTGLADMDLDFSKWDVKFLAGTIAELRESGMSDAEIMESSEVNDYTSNLVFGKIRTLRQKASRKGWMKSRRGAVTARANPRRRLQTGVERKFEEPYEPLGPEFRHLPEQPVGDTQLSGTSNFRQKSFDEATALLGAVIADRLFSEKDPQGRISAEDREWFGDWAHGRLEELFARDPKWNRRLRGPRGRDHAYMWVGHWMDAFMKSPGAFKDREHGRKRKLEMRGLGRSVRGHGKVRRNPDPVRWSRMETVTFDEVPVEDWFRAMDGREFTKVSRKEAILWGTDERYVFEPGDFVKAWMSYRREKR